jgi:hypothetical protein
MFAVVDAVTLISTTTTGSPYANELADLQLPLLGIPDEYVDNLTTHDLFIATDQASFIWTGTGNDTIYDNSNIGNVAIDPGGGANFIQVSSNAFSRDTIVVDAEGDAPLIDAIAGLKVGDDVVIKGLTALSPNDITNTTLGTLQGLMLTPHVPVRGPAAQIFLSGYNTSDLTSEVD